MVRVQRMTGHNSSIQPNEVRTFPKGLAEILRIGGARGTR